MIENHTIIPYGKQEITEEDIASVINTLKADFLTQGPKIAEFEENFAKYIGSQYAVAVSNGTAALHLATLALGLLPKQKVITTPITFAATSNCVKYCGAEVVFADIDVDTYLMDIKHVRSLLQNSPQGTYCGIIPVDMAGRAVNLEEFRKLANEYNLWIIEDACHAPGGYFQDIKGQNQNCGNGQFADLSVFSFHPVKHIACGEGGMITTNSKELYSKLISLRTHGILKSVDDFKNPISISGGTNSYPKWYMEMQNLGYNYRLTDIQAALGISQLNRAEKGIKKRRDIANTYNLAFENKSFVIRQSGVVDGHAYHLYILEVKDRLGLYNYLRKNNVFAQIHYFPTHLMPYYQEDGWKVGDMPIAENYYKNCISLPMYPSLSNKDLQLVINLILKYYE